MMEIEEKCHLIEEFVREYTKYEFSGTNKEFIDFLSYNDLGVPMAQAYIYDLVDLTDQGEAIIEETWKNLCTMVNTDPNASYETIYDMGYENNND